MFRRAEARYMRYLSHSRKVDVHIVRGLTPYPVGSGSSQTLNGKMCLSGDLLTEDRSNAHFEQCYRWRLYCRYYCVPD